MLRCFIGRHKKLCIFNFRFNFVWCSSIATFDLMSYCEVLRVKFYTAVPHFYCLISIVINIYTYIIKDILRISLIVYLKHLPSVGIYLLFVIEERCGTYVFHRSVFTLQPTFNIFNERKHRRRNTPPAVSLTLKEMVYRNVKFRLLCFLHALTNCFLVFMYSWCSM